MSENNIYKHYITIGIKHKYEISLKKFMYYKNNFTLKEKIYIENMNIKSIIEKLESKNIKLIISNGDYTESSGGITVLHYFCHLLNYAAGKQVAYISSVFDLSQVTRESYRTLITNPNYITPCATYDLLINRNNIIVYMDSVIGNPLEQKYVIRWVLYVELASRIKKWNKDDLIIWFIDTYQKYSENMQKINNEDPIHYKDIKNKQTIAPIISNISEILKMGDNRQDNERKNICFTTRKSGNNINLDRKLRVFKEDSPLCDNCTKKIWPCICNCKEYANGVKILHSNEEGLTYRFEYPTNLKDDIELFRNCKAFYMYDPFCFSATIAALNGCVTIVPKLDVFGSDDIYECVPWMKYGISYGTDEYSIKEAINTLPIVKQKLENILYELNYNSIKTIFEFISENIL